MELFNTSELLDFVFSKKNPQRKFQTRTHIKIWKVWKFRFEAGRLSESKQEEILSILGYKCKKEREEAIWQLP